MYHRKTFSNNNCNNRDDNYDEVHDAHDDDYLIDDVEDR